MNIDILIIGNCQAPGLGDAIETLLPGTRAKGIHVASRKSRETVAGLSLKAKHIWIHARSPSVELPDYLSIVPREKLTIVPPIIFRGFHPDVSYVSSSTGGWIGPGAYSSKLALVSRKHGFSISKTLKMYHPESIAMLEWGDGFKDELQALTRYLDTFGLPGEMLVAKWQERPFMHVINHPRVDVLVDIALEILKKQGHKPYAPLSTAPLRDRLGHIFWPIYPGLGLKGEDLAMRFGTKDSQNPGNLKIFGIKEYLESVWEKIPRKLLKDIAIPDESRILQAAKRLDRVAVPSVLGEQLQNPYKGLEKKSFWKSAMAEDVNPADGMLPIIESETRIATAGSCFAQHLAKRVAAAGLKYLVTESAPVGMASADVVSRQFGLFTARYGNIYTTRQFLQLLEEAVSGNVRLRPILRSDGAFIDGLRPSVEPGGFGSLEDLAASRLEHLMAVREAIADTHVFVFTMGLTEAWISRTDGTVFAVTPGAIGIEAAGGPFTFHNFSYSEVLQDIFEIYGLLRSANPEIQLLLTVSPVPLVATYENRHVLTSTVASKSILRAAANEAVYRLKGCFYFPSFEIITGPHAKGGYFEDDLRSVTSEGVDHVMRCFFSTMLGKSIPIAEKQEPLEELQRLAEIVCDEDKFYR